MEKTQNLRKVLAQNIKNARTSLHISQEKLSEHASISTSYMHDIEYCKTWVSDKTLNNIARALNMEAYELLMPKKTKEASEAEKEKAALRKTAELVNAKKRELRKATGEAMDNLILEIIKVHGSSG